MAYEVHLDVFDGPFDLLLRLISAQEVDLYEIPLTAIVDAFVAEVTRRTTIDLELSTEFLLIAATLVELKCRRLLPGPSDLDLDEDLSLLEARDYLLARLLECRTFAGAAEALGHLEAAASLSVGRHAGPDERFEEVEVDLLAGVTGAQLARALARAIAAKPPPPTVEATHVIADEVSVAAVLPAIAERVRSAGSATFFELTAGDSTARRVACFLAVLELYKAALVELDQLESFGELRISWRAGEEDGMEELLEAAAAAVRQ